MKRGIQFDCKHPGAVQVYCSTFSTIERVKLCPTCQKAINDNQQDPRGVAETISGALDLRNVKHHAYVPDPGSTSGACNLCGERHD